MKQPTVEDSASVTIRPARDDDWQALTRLAAFDSTIGIPPMPVLVAEEDGDLRAALSLSDGSSIANPFFRTRHLLQLLELQAAAKRPAHSSRALSRPARLRAFAPRLG